jgi:polysaccharide biosynthesis transport protein
MNMNNGAPAKGFSPFAVLRSLKRRKFYLLVPLLLLPPATYYYAKRLTQTFRARALVGAEPLIPGEQAANNRVDPNTVSAQEELRAIRETLFNSPALESVARDVALPPSEDIKSKIQIQVDGPESFYIGYEGSDPEQVAKVANRLADVFVERTSNLRDQQVEQQDDVLDQEVDRLRNQLTAQEEGLKAYKERVSQELPERLATNLKELENVQEQIRIKSDQITEAEARISSINEELKSLEKQQVMQDEPPAKTPEQLHLEQLKMNLNQLLARYTPENPEVIRAQKEIRDLEAVTKAPTKATPHPPTQAQMRYIDLQAELKSIGPRLASYRQQKDALTVQAHDYEQRVNASPGYEAAVGDRTKDAAMLRARYEALYAKQQEAKLNQRAEKTNDGLEFKILEPAQVPTAPSSPHRDRIMLFGALASLALGLMGVFVAEQMDKTFESAEEFEDFANLPVVSTVPAIPPRLPRQMRKILKPQSGWLPSDQTLFSPQELKQFQKNRVAVLSDPQSIASQQYGILALKVGQWMRRKQGRILVLTSSTGEEGKSVTALNLSLALAASSHGRVLLIDGDLRRPQVHQRLGFEPTMGFSDLLGSGADVAFYIKKIGNLDVITGGSEPVNPVGLLAAPRTREVLAQLREQYDLIVVDSPPLIPIADSHILAGLADGVLLVVRARKTQPQLFQRILKDLDASNVIGVVLNDVEFAATPYAYAYHYYQRHYSARG